MMRGPSWRRYEAGSAPPRRIAATTGRSRYANRNTVPNDSPSTPIAMNASTRASRLIREKRGGYSTL
jgi:hypothetical protein